MNFLAKLYNLLYASNCLKTALIHFIEMVTGTKHQYHIIDQKKAVTLKKYPQFVHRWTKKGRI